MKKIYLEWIEKAEGDYNSALRELRARKEPNYDAACFHAQQCVEKYLKAVLQKQNIYIPKTHDLNNLLSLLNNILPALELYRNDLKLLTSYAVEIRYPGETATKGDAKDCVKIMLIIRTVIRNELVFEEE